MPELKQYAVISGELSSIEPILDDGSGPTEYYRCYVELEALNRNDARKKAIKMKDMKDWVEYKRENNECPLGGLTVKTFEELTQESE